MKELQKKVAELEASLQESQRQVEQLASQSVAVEVTLRRELDQYRLQEIEQLAAKAEHYRTLHEQPVESEKGE